WADADEVVQRYNRKPGIHYTALWLNLKGTGKGASIRYFSILMGTMKSGDSPPRSSNSFSISSS
ncbi:MAG TPA: hypothetical protein VK187_07590, partial [Geobacteraceae bacterium]|nr:hypothetical protein [Geobacteraceae bacterium]